MRLHASLTLLAPLVLLAGCGLEAVDTRIQARSAAGIALHPLVVAEQQFVCPNQVSIGEQPFDAKTVASGEVEQQFGPFVPCNTVVPAGTGTCPNCKQMYRTSGPAPDFSVDGEEPLPVMALPKFECPHCKELVDPVAVLNRGSQQARLGDSACPKCNRYFTVVAADEALAVDVPEEAYCPGCKQPVDPTMNVCSNNACKLGGMVRNIDRFDGVCWHCGGLGLCPNCSGSGQGSQKIYGATPATCYVCEGNEEAPGRCPDCGGTGFAVYEGSLPNDYTAWNKTPDGPQAVPYAQRKWKHERGAGGAGEEDLGGEDLGDVGE